jgi:hypothetical protein
VWLLKETMKGIFKKKYLKKNRVNYSKLKIGLLIYGKLKVKKVNLKNWVKLFVILLFFLLFL